MPIKDPEKKRAYDSWYYRTHKEYRERAVQRSKERARQIRSWLHEYKSTLACEKCGENHPACLVFHHRNPAEKIGDITTLIGRRFAISKILAEIKKCQVLCANCHAKFHYNENQKGDRN